MNRPTVPQSPTTRRRAAFTLIELLVVLGIIILLVSIILPAVGRAFVQARTAQTWSHIQAIGGAITNYHLNQKAYPGLYSNQQLATGVTVPAIAGGGTRLTGTENAVASLIGGFVNDGTTVNVKYDPSKAGTGASQFTTNMTKRTKLAPFTDASAFLPPGYASGAVAADFPEAIGTPPAVKDTGMAEFVDAYSVPRPIIYLRANLGANATTPPVLTAIATMVSGEAFNPNYNYDGSELGYYKRGPAGDFTGDFKWEPAGGGDYFKDEDDYLKNPAVANTARAPDKFVLISAGADRIYGTRDDIFYGLSSNNLRSNDRRRRRAAGFTLVEMIVVIGIIILLMGIILPALNRAWTASTRQQMNADLGAISTALVEYKNKYGDIPRISAVNTGPAKLYQALGKPFRERADAKLNPPLVDPDRIKSDGNTFLDRGGRPILYFPANKVATITAANGYVASVTNYTAAGPRPYFNAADCDMKLLDELESSNATVGLEKFKKMLGARPDGSADPAFSQATGEYLLYCAGPDRKFGLPKNDEISPINKSDDVGTFPYRY